MAQTTDHKTTDQKTGDVTTYILKQALAARVDDHVEIAVEAEDGTTFKIRATSDQLDALTGDLETILEADDADA